LESILGQKPPTEIVDDKPESVVDPVKPVVTYGEFISERIPAKLNTIPASAELVYNFGGFIYVMDRNGNNVTQITFENPRGWEHVAVSYDRRYVIGNAYVSGIESGGSAITLFDLVDGTEARLVPHFVAAGSGGIDWDNKGFIYFAGSVDTGLSDVYKVKLDGTQLIKLTNTARYGEPDVSVSEDSRRVAYIQGQPVSGTGADTLIQNWIRIMNANGTNNKLVLKGKNTGYVGKAGPADPEISPDGSKIVFSDENQNVPGLFPDIPGLNTSHDIWTVNTDGTNPIKLTPSGDIFIIPDWKYNSIVFTQVRPDGGNAWIMNDDGTGQKLIKRKAHTVRWIP
jgi:Tol biopolymer transport system component